MIPKITIFVSSPTTPEEDSIVKKFLELKFAPLVDANHKRNYTWFVQNVKPIPHKLFAIEQQNVYFYEVDDLHENMVFSPQFMIYWNDDVQVYQEEWNWIREWLIYEFFTKYDYFDYMNENIKRANEIMKRPVTDLVVPLQKPEKILDHEESYYAFKTRFIEDRDTMLYEVKKPFTDLPYTSVIRNFSKRGHEAFFPSLYICKSWGVSRNDLPFLSFIWKQLEMKGEFDMDQMLKEATEKCYPSSTHPPEPEPEVYRRTMEDVLATLQVQEEGILCGHVFSDIPEEIKNRFK